MRPLLLMVIALLCGSAGLHAQSFTVSLIPKHQTIHAGEKASCDITITPSGGFSASATIAVSSPTIWIPDYYYTRVINDPYTPARFDVPTPYSALGTNMVIIEAGNGPVKARDTCYIEIVPSRRSAGWTYLTPRNSDNPNSSIHLMAVDRNNVGWISTAKGIARYDKTDWSFIPDPWPDAKPAFMEIDSRNRLVINQGYTIGRYDGSSWKVFHVPGEFVGSSNVNGFATQGDTFWVATASRGICRYDGSTWTHLTKATGLPDDRVYKLFVDHRGRLWAGIGKGIGSFDGTFWTFRESAEYGLDTDYLLRGFQPGPDNAVWAFDHTNAVVVDGPAHPPVDYHDVTGDVQGIDITSMTFDREGRQWFSRATLGSPEHRGGLHYFDNGVWQRISMENSGLSDNLVHKIIIDGSGTWWIGTHSSGLALFNPAASGVEKSGEEIKEPILLSAIPNPMRDQGSALLRISSRARVTAVLYDLLGCEVARFVEGTMDAGDHLIPIDLSGAPSGAYFLRVTAGTASETHRIVK